MPQVKKICVDSRFANPLSKSSTDFKMDLTDSIMLPDNTSVIITDISIPHSWYSVEYFNENFYFRVVEPDPENGAISINDFIVKLQRKNYDIDSLAEELQFQMNAAYGSDIFFTSTTHPTARIAITIMGTERSFYIFSDKDLLNRVNGTWVGENYDSFRPNTCNSIIGFNGSYNFAAPSYYWTQWVSGVVDVLGIHNIYITSPQFGRNSFGPKGERNILKKLVVNAPFGGLVTESWLNDQDYTDCSKHLLRTLEFRITDSYGNTLELNGGHVSFTLIFVFT